MPPAREIGSRHGIEDLLPQLWRARPSASPAGLAQPRRNMAVSCDAAWQCSCTQVRTGSNDHEQAPGARETVKVGDVMTKQPAVVGLDTPVREAAELMRSKVVRHLPVVDEAGHVAGILTDRDLRHAAFMPALAEQAGWEPHRAKAPRVRDVMTWSVVTTHPDTPLVQAALTMFQRRIGSLPVVADGRLVGIVTEWDVFTGLRGGRRVDEATDPFLW